MDPYECGLAYSTSHRRALCQSQMCIVLVTDVCVTLFSIRFQSQETMQKWEEYEEVRTKCNEMGLLILDILERTVLPYKVWRLTTVFSVMRQLYLSNRRSYLRLYCLLIHPHHLLSEMKTGKYTLALGAPCLAPTEWYCLPVTSQCGAICSNWLSLKTQIQLVSWCKNGPIMLRISSILTIV